MPNLTECNSVFQLAAGLNLIVSVIISDFDKTREQIGDAILRQIQDKVPDFTIPGAHRRFCSSPCYTSLEPSRLISTPQFKWFFVLTLVVSPAMYLLQSLLMRQVLFLLADHGLARKIDAQIFIRSFQISREAAETTTELKEKLQDAELFMFKTRWALWWRSGRGTWHRMLRWIRR
jgi:hypothetical protein